MKNWKLWGERKEEWGKKNIEMVKNKSYKKIKKIQQIQSATWYGKRKMFWKSLKNQEKTMFQEKGIVSIKAHNSFKEKNNIKDAC